MDVAALPIPTKAGRHNAFTFIEVTAALAIASIALLGLLHLHLLSLQTADTAQTMAQAVLLAEERLAEVACSERPEIGTRTGTVETNGARFAWRTEVTHFDPLRLHRPDTLRRVRVNVTWRGGVRSEGVQITSCIADRRVYE